MGLSWGDKERAINRHFDDQNLARQAEQMRKMSEDKDTFDRKTRAKYAANAKRLEKEGGR